MKSRKQSQRNKFGKRLRALRNTARITQAALAEAVGVKRPYLSQLEARASPSPDLAAALAAKLKASRQDELELVLLSLDAAAPAAARVLRRAVARSEHDQLLFEIAYEDVWLRDYWSELRKQSDERELRELVRDAVAEVREQLPAGLPERAPRLEIWNALISRALARGMSLPSAG